MALSNVPMLAVDASSEGLGMVLSQAGPELEPIVAYFSQILRRLGCNYCVT